MSSGRLGAAAAIKALLAWAAGPMAQNKVVVLLLRDWPQLQAQGVMHDSAAEVHA